VLTPYTKLVPANSLRGMAAAAGCVAVGTLARLALASVIGPTAPFITMFPAVLMASVIGGFWPGLLAIGLSALATWFLFIHPSFQFSTLAAAEIVNLILYLLGAYLIVLVATSMRSALEKLENTQEKLFAALDASRTGTWRWNIDDDLLEWDPAMSTVFGLDPARSPRSAEAFFTLLHSEDVERVREAIRRAVKTRGTAECEFRVVLSDGGERWIYDRSRAIVSEEGHSRYMIGACLDITERKQAEERQVLLIHELNHRVKNTLATVQSLAIQTLRSSRNSEAFQANFMSRLMALSATHDILTLKLWESASIGEILAAELQPYGGIDQNRIEARGDVVHLKPRQALSLGMALHELATNAAKYGALSSPHGRIRISWSVDQTQSTEPRLVIRWREEGGPAVKVPKRRGFGTRLIDRSIAHELGGDIEMKFAPTGLDCTFRVPMEET
jgi:PAS domain S-box-containing protein